MTISGGVVGDGFDAFHDSRVNITGGEISGHFTAHGGSIVNISGGTIGHDFAPTPEARFIYSELTFC